MKDFIINLYANKYFPIYLGVVIIVLLIAFFIVFFLGKKDQKKIEKTQKLNLEKLKEAQNSAVVTNNEVKANVQSVPVQNTPVEPKVQPAVAPVVSQPTNTVSEVKPVTVNQTVQTPVTPVVEPVKVAPVMEVKNEVPITPKVVETPVKEVTPVIPPVMEVPTKPTPEITKPVVDEEVYRVNKKEEETVNRLKELSSSLDKEMKTFETKPLVTPEVEKASEEKPKVMNVYSSVYVPNNNNVVTPVKEETPVVENNDDDLNDTMAIELPKLKTEEPILKDNTSDSLNLL